MNRIFQKKPYDLEQSNGDGRRLQDVELAARGLDNLGYAGHSLVKDLKLPAFGNPAKLAWPPPQIPFGVQIAATIPRAAAPATPRRRDQLVERDRQAVADAERAAAQAKVRQREREGREAAEARAAVEKDRKMKRQGGWPV